MRFLLTEEEAPLYSEKGSIQTFNTTEVKTSPLRSTYSQRLCSTERLPACWRKTVIGYMWTFDPRGKEESLNIQHCSKMCSLSERQKEIALKKRKSKECFPVVCLALSFYSCFRNSGSISFHALSLRSKAQQEMFYFRCVHTAGKKHIFMCIVSKCADRQKEHCTAAHAAQQLH